MMNRKIILKMKLWIFHLRYRNTNNNQIIYYINTQYFYLQVIILRVNFIYLFINELLCIMALGLRQTLEELSTVRDQIKTKTYLARVHHQPRDGVLHFTLALMDDAVGQERNRPLFCIRLE